MKKILLVLITLISADCYAIDLNLPVTAIQNSLCGLTILSQSPGSSFVNPALCYPGLASSTSRLYNYHDLPLHHLSLVYSYGSWGIGTGGSYLHHPFYSELTAGLSVSAAYRDFRLGILMRYLMNDVADHHNAKILLFDAAVLWSSTITETTFMYKNIFAEKILGSDLPIFLIWESKFKVSECIKLGLGFEKQSKKEFILRSGSCYRISNNFEITIGYQYEPQRLGAGIKVSLSGIDLSYGMQTHRYLPLTHSISLDYEIITN